MKAMAPPILKAKANQLGIASTWSFFSDMGTIIFTRTGSDKGVQEQISQGIDRMSVCTCGDDCHRQMGNSHGVLRKRVRRNWWRVFLDDNGILGGVEDHTLFI